MNSENPVIKIAGLVSLGIALGISLYLAGNSLGGASVAGCSGEGSGCHNVLSSKWAYILGVPVSLTGLPIYGALLFFSIFPSRHSQLLKGTLSVLVVGAALWFAGVQLLILKSFCPWCCTTHGFAVAGTLLLAVSSRQERAPHRLILSTSFALPALGGLIFLQFLSSAPDQSKQASLGDAGALKDENNFISLHGGEFLLNPEDFPVIGSPRARHTVVALGDYTCGFCRKLHGQLQQIVSSYPEGELAVIELPVARDAKAAEIQRLMLSLWKSHPETKKTLDTRIHERRLSIEPNTIRTAAEELVGAEAVRTALADHAAWAEQQIEVASQVLKANSKITGAPHLPQLIAGEEVNIGASKDLETYTELFARNYDLASPDLNALARFSNSPRNPEPALAIATVQANTEILWPTRERQLELTPRSPGILWPVSSLLAPTQLGRKKRNKDNPQVAAGYFGWILRNFEMPGEMLLADPAANPDGDASRNALEYWCRLDPKQRDNSPGLIHRGRNGNMVYSLEMRDDDPAIGGVFQFSDDLHFTDTETLPFLRQNLLTRIQWTVFKPGWPPTLKINLASLASHVQLSRSIGPLIPNACSNVPRSQSPPARVTPLRSTPSLKPAWTRAPVVGVTKFLIPSVDAMGKPTPMPAQLLKPTRAWNILEPASNPSVPAMPTVVILNTVSRRKAATPQEHAGRDPCSAPLSSNLSAGAMETLTAMPAPPQPQESMWSEKEPVWQMAGATAMPTAAMLTTASPKRVAMYREPARKNPNFAPANSTRSVAVTVGPTGTHAWRPLLESTWSAREPALQKNNAIPTLTAMRPITVFPRKDATRREPAGQDRKSVPLKLIRSVGVTGKPTEMHASPPAQGSTSPARVSVRSSTSAIPTPTATMPITASPRKAVTPREPVSPSRSSAPANSARYVAAMEGPMEMPVRQPQRE